MKRSAIFTVLIGAPAAFTFATDAAEARIICNKGFQNVDGSMISTPYCQDNYLAQVARQYGLKTSNSAIRQNPNHKRYVCGIVGHDIRIRNACEPVIGPNRRRF